MSAIFFILLPTFIRDFLIAWLGTFVTNRDPAIMVRIKFNMPSSEADINVWDKHGHDESSWKDAKQSEARKKLGYIS